MSAVSRIEPTIILPVRVAEPASLKVTNTVVTTLHQAAAYLNEPVCKAHEYFRRMQVVDTQNPDSYIVTNLVRKVAYVMGMAGWIGLALFATIPGIILGSIASRLQEHPYIVSIGDPVLRKKARDLSVEEILSPEIQSLIEKMKETMRAAPGVGLAAPQIGRSLQLAVIEDMDHSHLTPEQLKERERDKVPFHVIINPRIYFEGEEKAEFFEGCLSIPELIGVVPRARAVRVECLNEKGEPVTIHAKGWHSRILQHEIDHLNGRLYIDRAFLPTMMNMENYEKCWKGKGAQEVKSILTNHLFEGWHECCCAC